MHTSGCHAKHNGIVRVLMLDKRCVSSHSALRQESCNASRQEEITTDLEPVYTDDLIDGYIKPTLYTLLFNGRYARQL